MIHTERLAHKTGQSSISLRQNPKITSYTGKHPPYGYLDWWPVSLWMNTQLAPYSNPQS